MTYPLNSTEAIRAAWDSRVDEYAKMLSDPGQRGLAAAIELAAFENALSSSTGQTILDAGCGPGFHGCRLLAKGHRVTFADVSPEMLQKVKQAIPKEHESRASFLQADIRDLSKLQDGSFDAVISGGTVISDCGNPTAAMTEIRRVLKRKGIFGFSVRNLNGPQQKGAGRELVSGGGPGFDWWFFSRESVAELCRKSGFTCARTYPVLMEPPVAGSRIEDAVKRHLDAKDPDVWRPLAWEMFVLAEKGL